MVSHASLTAAADLATTFLPSGLDVLIVNGAYVNRETAFLSPTDYSSASQAKLLHDDMHASLDTNVLGVVYSINAFLPLVLKGSVKKIIVTSTGMADADLSLDGLTAQVAYSSMKAALNMVVAKFATELRPKGVMTLALCPGVVQTRETARESLLLSCPTIDTGILICLMDKDNNWTIATEEEIQNYQALGEIFLRKYPHWKGPYSPIQSIEYQMKVIDGLKIEDSGKFLSHHGNKNWL